MTQRGGKLYNVLCDICGFANTNGGTLYLGVSRDPKHPPAGVSNAEQAAKELRVALDRQLTPRLTCTIDTQTSRGKTIVRVRVPRGDDLPYALDENKIYLRQEAETSLAVRDEIVELVLRRHAPSPPTPTPAPVAAPPAAEKTAPDKPASNGGAPGPERLGPPRTGVEIVATESRNGVRYHTMRDLRNNSLIKNVTRSSARKLWHYAIAEREANLPKPEAVTWFGDLGLYKKREKGGVLRYDLVQRAPEGLRVFFGVTEDGIHGEWRKVAGLEATPPPLPPAEAKTPSLFEVAAEPEEASAPSPVEESKPVEPPAPAEAPPAAKSKRARKPRGAKAAAEAPGVEVAPAPEAEPKPKKARAAKPKAPAAKPKAKPARAKKPKAPANADS
jgi:hypothetical protein